MHSEEGDVQPPPAGRRWYGADEYPMRTDHGRRRARMVLAGALGAIATVLVISPLDLRLAKPGMTRVAEKFDKGAGRFVVSETDTLLSKGAAKTVHLQRLLDMSEVSAAAKREISALQNIRKGWGFAGDELSARPSANGGGPSGAIIASATDIYEKASKLAGDSKSAQLQGAGAWADASDAADAVSLAAASSKSTAKPFAKDKGWSLAKEKSDMDAFYDSLDHKAAVKEAAARKKLEAKAAFRATVAKAKAELKEIDEENAARKHAALPSSPAKASPPATTDSKQDATPEIAPATAHEGHAATAKKVPKLSSEASRAKIQGYFDGLVNAAKKHADLAHPAEKHPTLTADAARDTINAYFKSLEPRTKAQAHASAKSAKAPQTKLTDAQARKGALSFFDAEVKRERAQMRLVAKKLGVRKAADTVEKLQAATPVAVTPDESKAGPVAPTKVIAAPKPAAVASKALKAAAAAPTAPEPAAAAPKVQPAAIAEASAHELAASALKPKAAAAAPKAPEPAAAAPKVQPAAIAKARAHELAASALKAHDAVVAAQQKQAEADLLKTSSSHAPAEATAQVRAAVPKAKTAAMMAKKAEMANLRGLSKVKVQLEQWPYVP